MKRIFLIITILLNMGIFSAYTQEAPHAVNESPEMYFCTACNDKYFDHAINLIGSIFRVNFDQTHEIAVFDIGLNAQHKAFLNSIAKVKVYEVR